VEAAADAEVVEEEVVEEGEVVEVIVEMT